MLMRADMVVPETKEVQVFLRLAGVQSPEAGDFLEGLEEALDTPVLPGSEGSRELMANAEEAEPEAEERRGEDRLVVGTDASRFAEEIDGVEDGAKDGDGGLALQVAERQTGAGTVVDQTEDSALAARLAEVGEVGGPDDVGAIAFGLLCLSRRRMSAISWWRWRSTVATKVLPTVILRR